MDTNAVSVIEPLLRRRVFATEEQAARELMRDYILRQIDALQQEMSRFERKYGMSFERFGDYLHEHSVALSEGELDSQQRQALGMAIMQEEEDWLEWKAAQEMLDNWLGLRQEAAV